jgi:hypothetical protein
MISCDILGDGVCEIANFNAQDWELQILPDIPLRMREYSRITHAQSPVSYISRIMA